MKLIRMVFGSKGVCIFLLLVGFAFAQGQAQGVGGGLSISAIASQIDGDDWGGYKKLGYSFGGYVFYDLTDRITLQIEIQQSLRGSREVQTAYSQIALNFIDVPVLLKYGFQRKKGKISLESGFSANILLSARVGIKPFGLDQTENYHRFSSEYHLGLSYETNKKISFFGKWSLGITNLYDSPATRPWFTIHYFSAGLRLGLR